MRVRDLLAGSAALVLALGVTGSAWADASESDHSEPAADATSEEAAAISPGLVLSTLANGVEYHGAPGALVAAGSDIEWTYELTNTGDTDLLLVSLAEEWIAGDGSTGSQEIDLAAEGEDDAAEHVLEPGEDLIVSRTAAIPAGQFESTVTATATPVDEAGAAIGEDYVTTTKAWAFGGEAGLTVTTSVNGATPAQPPGPSFAVGDEVAWQYVVTNTGTLPLTNVTLAEVGGTGGAQKELNTTEWHTLAPGESATAQRTASAERGQFASTTKVTGESEAGVAEAADATWFYGGTPNLTASVTVNGLGPDEPPATVATGSTIEVELTVTNTGDTWLTDLGPTATMTTGGAVTSIPLETDATGLLAPGAERSFTADLVAPAGTSTIEATAAATASTAHGDRLEPLPAAASAQTSFVAGDVGLVVRKTVNGVETDSAPGLAVPVGTEMTWEYTVTNAGTVALGPITLVDTETTPASVAGGAPGTVVLEQQIASLAPGASTTLSATGTARAGLYRNTVEVRAEDPRTPGSSFAAADESHYTGGVGSLAVTKLVATSPDGPFEPETTAQLDQEVTWQVTIANTGEIALADIAVLDPALGATDRIESLDPGAQATVTFTSVAESDLVNEVTVTATRPTGEEVTATASAQLTVADAAETDSAQPSEPPMEDTGGGSGLLVAGIVVLLAAAAGGGWLWWRRRAQGAAPGDGETPPAGTGMEG